jgi:hypothetical protein
MRQATAFVELIVSAISPHSRVAAALDSAVMEAWQRDPGFIVLPDSHFKKMAPS